MKLTVVILTSSGLLIPAFFFNVKCILCVVQLYLKISNQNLLVKNLLCPLCMLDLSKPENPSKSQNLINNRSRRVSFMRKHVDPMEVMNTVKTRCVSRDVKLTGKIWHGPDRIVQGRSKIIEPFIETGGGAARYGDLNSDEPAYK